MRVGEEGVGEGRGEWKEERGREKKNMQVPLSGTSEVNMNCLPWVHPYFCQSLTMDCLFLLSVALNEREEKQSNTFDMLCFLYLGLTSF